MSSEASNILAQLVAEFETFAAPLAAAVSRGGGVYDFLAIRGWNLKTLQTADLSAFATLVDTLQQGLTDLQAIQSYEDIQGIVKAVGDLGNTLAQLQSIRDTLVGAAAVQLTTAQAEELAADVIQSLLFAYLQRRFPKTYQVLIGITLIQIETATQLLDAGGGLLRYPIRRATLRFDNLGKLLKDPLAHLKSTYFPSSGLTDEAAAIELTNRLFGQLEVIVLALGGQAMAGLRDPLDSEITNPTDPTLRRSFTLAFSPPSVPIGGGAATLGSQFGSTLVVVPADGRASDNTAGPALEVVPFGLASLGAQFGSWTVGLTLGGQASPLVITSQGVRFTDPAASRLELEFDLSKGAAGTPALLVGSASGTRLQIDTIGFTTSLSLSGTDRDYGFLLDLHKAALIIAAGDGDGFLQKVLPPDGFRTDFDLAVGWSAKRGLYFRGAAGLDAELPLGIDLFGILKIDSVFVSLRAKLDQGPPGGSLTLAVTTILKIGPFTAIAERFGALANITFPPSGGNLGAADFGLGFKPPSGIGMSLSSGPVRGGGYLFIDPDAGQYAGILQLEFSQIAIKAIGILNTRMPDGSQGFSLLIIITVEFTPIQLGYGFTLNGVGGLIGANRDMLLEPLRAGVKNHTLDSILFPTDPVANAKKIIGDLSAIFPPAEGRFAFGLMAKLGWGASIITAELGVIIVLLEPIRLAILGKIQLVLPEDDEDAVVRLKLDVLGSIDFDKGDLGIDASIYDSRIAIFDIAGDMALRVSWGASPAFAFAVGGFNPQFPVPAGFPKLARISLSLATSDNPRIRLETYLALTANTVQIGAQIDVHAEFSLLGTWSVDAFMGFDALIYFSPFHFELDVYGGAALKHNGSPFLAIDLRLSVSGPSYWVVHGQASFDFFGHHAVEIDRTFGDPQPPAPAPITDPLDNLKTVIEDPRSWSAQMPDGAGMVVTLRAIDAPGVVLMHPLGRISVTQRVLPLGVSITHFGGSQIGDTRVTDIASVRIGTQSDADAAQNVSNATSAREKFAPGQFFDLTEDQKLSGPEFEPLPAGLSGVGSSQVTWGTATGATFDYETVVIDELQPQPVRANDAYHVRDEVAKSLARLSAAGRAPSRNQGSALFRGPSKGIAVSDPQYCIVSKNDMSRAAGTGNSASRTEALGKLNETDDSGDLQIVGAHEEAVV